MKLLHYKVSENATIYRYVSFHQFVSFVEKEKTYLSKVINWEDPYEDIIKNLPVKNSAHKFGDFRGTGEYYGQSWSLDGNSDAMWRIYSRDKKGVLLKTTIKKLKKLQDLKVCLIGKVEYYSDLKRSLKKLVDTEPRSLQASTLKYPLLKRDAFRHESEVRLITVYHKDYMNTRKFEESDFIELDLNPNDFLDELIIDPRAPEWFAETVNQFVKNRNLEIEVTKSSLYRFEDESLKNLEVEFSK